MDFASDIPLALAGDAHRGTSFVPDRRAQQERDDYNATLRADYEQLAALCDTDEKRAKLEDEFARYRAGYRAKTVQHLIAKSRVMSTMITGPSNFPTERNRKRCDTERRRLEELIDFRERALKAIRRELCPELRPIMSGDADATGRLAAKIAEAEAWQEAVKADNAKMRKAKLSADDPDLAAKLAALGLTEWTVKEIITLARVCPYHLRPYCRIPAYALSNNSANIRRMKERAERVETAQASPTTETRGTNARLEDCPAENRIRLFFPGKPAQEVREQLKASGFRWAPSLGCWQAYRNYRSIETAKTVAGTEGGAE